MKMNHKGKKKSNEGRYVYKRGRKSISNLYQVVIIVFFKKKDGIE